MKVAALVGAAEFNGGHFARQRFDRIIAVDGGYASLHAIGVEPDIALGDFDSLGYVPPSGEVLQVPAQKDESDMELGLRMARHWRCDAAVVYGGLGGRLDHTLANLLVMAGFARKGGRAWAIGGDYAVAVVHGDAESAGSLEFGRVPPGLFAGGSYGPFLSVFPLGGTAYGVSESGLKYELDDVDLADGASLGLSNEFTGAPASVSVARGDLVVTFPLAAWDYIL